MAPATRYPLEWDEHDRAKGPDGIGYALGSAVVRGEPPTWYAVVFGPDGEERLGVWPTKRRVIAACERDAQRRYEAQQGGGLSGG
jgi:hypothetical protein